MGMISLNFNFKNLLFISFIGVLFLFLWFAPRKADSSLNTDYIELGVSTGGPTVANVALNGGSNFSPNENTVKAVDVTGQVSDNDGCSDVTDITALVYRSGVGSSCASDDNNCYRDISCATSCSGTIVSATCEASIWFHADPTDSGTYSSEWWEGAIQATDAAESTDFGDSSSNTSVDVNTLLAIGAPTSLYYSVAPGQDTGSTNSTTNIEVTGNAAVDSSLKGTDMTQGAYSIGVTNQHYSLSSFTFDGGTENTLTGTDAALDLALGKPSSNSPSNESDIIYWGLKVESSNPPGNYFGTNTITATVAPCGGTTSFTYENTTYDTLVVGEDCWMAENLNVGTSIVGTTEQGTDCSNIDKYCYSDTESNCTTYGGLYQWDQAMCGASSCNGTGASQPECSSPVQGICPPGWHIPSHYEFTALERTVCESIGNTNCDTEFLYDESTSGWRGQDTTTAEGEGSALAGNTGSCGTWNSGELNNFDTCNNDFGTSGFDALPAGIRATDGSFGNLSDYAYFWSSFESDASDAWRRFLGYTETRVFRSTVVKVFGFSVRCVRD